MDGALVKLAHLRWTAERSRTLSAQVAAAAAAASAATALLRLGDDRLRLAIVGVT